MSFKKKYGFCKLKQLLNTTATLLLLIPFATSSAWAGVLTFKPIEAQPPTIKTLKPKVAAAVWRALKETAPTLSGLDPSTTRIRWKIEPSRPLPAGASVEQATCFTTTPKIAVTGIGLVQCKFSGKAQSMIGIPIELEQRLPVAFITQTVEARTALAGKFKVSAQWVSLSNKAKIAIVEETPSWASTTFSKQQLPIGTIVLQQHLSQPPAVTAQETVTVQLIIQSLNAPMTLVIEGIALETGRIGQSISVKCNHRSNNAKATTTFSGYHFAGKSSTTNEKIYRGLITEKSTVVVHL
jgi:Chaperone for flagella basal body P-ring formation